jgi:hypothetical protein
MRLEGIVERRLLVNYRTDPEVTARLLPQSLRPLVVNGYAVAGICLIRLGRLRPSGLPGALGLRSESAAHRIAVEWDTPEGTATGVYIPRRDSASRVNVAVGGRLFPGRHHLARFEVREAAGELLVGFTSRDGTAAVRVRAREAGEWRGSGVFASLDEASTFFRLGARGYSTPRTGRRLDGLELRTPAWRVEPVAVEAAHSSYFDDPGRFPPGSATLDCALLMRDTPVSWQPLAPLLVGAPVGAAPNVCEPADAGRRHGEEGSDV